MNEKKIFTIIYQSVWELEILSASGFERTRILSEKIKALIIECPT